MQKEARPFKRIWPAQLALFYNVIILSWVETRAAGGQYTDFPLSIRILYLFMSIGTSILIFYLRKLTSERVTSQDIKFARYLGWLFIVSTILQLISRSPDEQWNAIPAAVIATTFLLISRRG
jgi:hypothetical protein